LVNAANAAVLAASCDFVDVNADASAPGRADVECLNALAALTRASTANGTPETFDAGVAATPDCSGHAQIVRTSAAVPAL
jgi:hypothetical protein